MAAGWGQCDGVKRVPPLTARRTCLCAFWKIQIPRTHVGLTQGMEPENS